MAVERNPDGLPVDELIDSLVIGEIMGLEKVMDEIHIRHSPGPVDIPAINRPHFDDPVGIAGGKRQWGAGDFTPSVFGAVFFFLRSRPGKKELQEKLAETRREAAQVGPPPHLPVEAVREYRTNLINTGLAGAGAGLIAGALIGLAEAQWIGMNLQGLTELSACWWGPLAYGIACMGAGIGIACALAFLYLLVDRFASAALTFGLSLTSVIFLGGGLALWRY